MRPPAEYDKQEAFRLFNMGITIRSLARKFKVSDVTVRKDLADSRIASLKQAAEHPKAKTNACNPASPLGEHVNASIAFLQAEIAKTESILKMQRDCLASLQTVFAGVLRDGVQQ